MAISDLSLYLVCVSLVLCLLIQHSYCSNYDSYYGYVVSDGRSSIRPRRYVDGPISWLADNHQVGKQHHDKELVSFGQGRAMELVGDIPVRVPEHATSGYTTTTTQAKPDSSHPDILPSQTPPLTTTPTDRLLKKTDEKKPAPPEKKNLDQPKKGLESVEQPHSSSEDSSLSKPKDDFDVTRDFPREVTNITLEEKNITLKQEDQHQYYRSSFISDEKVSKDLWVDMANEEGVIVHEMLSKSHRRATTVKLRFDFPFYGHVVRNMTIATGGFLYTGDYIHSWLAATQYIAPLMANFDTSLSPDSKVKYRDNGTALTVEWERVYLQDRKEAGEFSFQATLHFSGDIVFVYKNIPLPVDKIDDVNHPVKVGLSDAYIIDKTIFFVRRKTIYEYHRVNFKREFIKNWTVIVLNAQPTCLSHQSCNACLNAHINFECYWCESVSRCSSGIDRRLQEWTVNQCEESSISEPQECDRHFFHRQADHHHLPHEAHTVEESSGSEGYGGHMTAGMLSVLLVAAVVMVGGGVWVLYAYRNPHTPSGQVLIKYRPSQWSLRRGEARYTAASIHM